MYQCEQGEVWGEERIEEVTAEKIRDATDDDRDGQEEDHQENYSKEITMCKQRRLAGHRFQNFRTVERSPVVAGGSPQM